MADPAYVLILSGDHIYTMDYAWMLEHHKKNKAQATMACSRFLGMRHRDSAL